MNTHCSKKKNAILRNRIFKIKVELKTATYSAYILYWVFNQHFKHTKVVLLLFVIKMYIFLQKYI